MRKIHWIFLSICYNSINSESSFKTCKSVKVTLNRCAICIDDTPQYVKSKLNYQKSGLTAKFDFFLLLATPWIKRLNTLTSDIKNWELEFGANICKTIYVLPFGGVGFNWKNAARD